MILIIAGSDFANFHLMILSSCCWTVLGYHNKFQSYLSQEMMKWCISHSVHSIQFKSFKKKINSVAIILEVIPILLTYPDIQILYITYNIALLLEYNSYFPKRYYWYCQVRDFYSVAVLNRHIGNRIALNMYEEQETGYWITQPVVKCKHRDVTDRDRLSDVVNTVGSNTLG